jgi:hypothetical protein
MTLAFDNLRLLVVFRKALLHFCHQFPDAGGCVDRVRPGQLVRRNDGQCKSVRIENRYFEKGRNGSLLGNRTGKRDVEKPEQGFYAAVLGIRSG